MSQFYQNRCNKHREKPREKAVLLGRRLTGREAKATACVKGLTVKNQEQPFTANQSTGRTDIEITLCPQA